MTEEEIAELKADIAIADARASVAIELVDSLLGLIVMQTGASLDIGDLVEPVIAKATKENDFATVAAIFDLRKRHGDPNHIANAIDGLFDEIGFQDNYRRFLVEKIRKDLHQAALDDPNARDPAR